MALTSSIVKRLPIKHFGGNRANLVDFTLNTYVTGGWPVTTTLAGLQRSLSVVLLSGGAKLGGLVSYDEVNKTLFAVDYAGTQLVNGSAALDGVVIRALVIGD